MDAPTYNPPPPDPTITALDAKAQQENIRALSETASIDTASLMARFGTRLAMAGSPTASPLAAPSPVRMS